MKKKVHKTCTSMECPERFSLCCSAISEKCKHMDTDAYISDGFDCSACGITFISPDCIAGEEGTYQDGYEAGWRAASVASREKIQILLEENNRVYKKGVDATIARIRFHEKQGYDTYITNVRELAKEMEGENERI